MLTLAASIHDFFCERRSFGEKKSWMVGLKPLLSG
jgi:hypothetical protein